RNCARHDALYLLRNTPTRAKEGSSAELHWVPIREPWSGLFVYRPAARTEARLVALGCVQRAFLERVTAVVVCGRATAPRAQSPGRLALPLEVEHHAARLLVVLVPLHSLRNHYPDSPVAGHSRL